MKISVLIPVYRKPKRAGDIVSRILSDTYSDKEIIVIVDDSTTPEIENALDPFRDRITIHYNGERLGKTESLNRVAHRIKTDILVFFDNDIELPTDTGYLSILAREMEKHDLIEIPKEGIAGSPVSRMMSLEFLSFAMMSWTMAVLAHRSPSMNGAAFAVTALLFRQLDGFRAVMHEDMDFAARAFQLGASFGYPPALKVRNEVPCTARDWLVQRKRWAMNNILWLRENFLLLAANMFRTPGIFFSTVLLFLPTLTYLAVFLLARKTHLAMLFPLIFMVSQHFHLITGLLLWFSHFHLITRAGLVATGVGLLAAAIVFFLYSRILRFRFNPLEFLFYYFIYSPIWMLTNVVMFILVLFGISVPIDWKVSRD